MVKYDDEFKLRIVQAYLNGNGSYGALSKQYCISAESIVRKWVNAFKTFGAEGLRRKQKNDSYTLKFKLDVIQSYLNSGKSFREVANQYGINNPSLISGWMRQFRNGGNEGLSKPKGRPSKLNNPKKLKKIKELTREQQLEHENELLRAELAFIKKLRASGINIPDRLMKSSLESSTNSGKNLD